VFYSHGRDLTRNREREDLSASATDPPFKEKYESIVIGPGGKVKVRRDIEEYEKKRRVRR